MGRSKRTLQTNSPRSNPAPPRPSTGESQPDAGAPPPTNPGPSLNELVFLVVGIVAGLLINIVTPLFPPVVILVIILVLFLIIAIVWAFRKRLPKNIANGLLLVLAPIFFMAIG